MNIDIPSLKIFTEVMELGSFATVARKKNLDPSSISRTISALEEETGTRLFQRTTRKLAPTEAGILLFDKIQPLLNELEDCFHAALDTTSNPRGTLRLTSSVAFGQKILAPLIVGFNKIYPLLKVELALTDRNLDLIEEQIDIAVRHGPPADTMLIGTRLKTTSYMVCASSTYLKNTENLETPEDLRNHDCLRMPLTGHKTLWRFKSEEENILEVPINGSITISNPMALLAAVLADGGPALLADWIAEDEVKKGNLVNLFPEYEVTATDFNTAVWLLYPSREYLPSKVRTFIEYMKKQKW